MAIRKKHKGIIKITLTNLNLFLKGPWDILNDLREDMKYRHPNAFHIKQAMKRHWDGYVHLLTEDGVAKTGFLNKIVAWLEKSEYEYIIIDNRDTIESVHIKEAVRGMELRPYQLEAIKAVINNSVGGVYFPSGIISAATNAGKTLMMAAIYLSFKGVKGMILLNDSNLYRQFLVDMPKLFGDKWGYCQGKKIKFGNITVAMVQTLVRHLPEYKRELFNIDILLVDECDLATSKTYTKVLKQIPNAFVKVGLSGTVFIRNLAKDRVKNNTVIGLFGNELFKIKNIELMEQGYSTPIVVKIHPGNAKLPRTNEYEEEYRIGITENRDRLEKALERVKYYMSREVYPILIVCRFHEHVERTFDYLQSQIGLKYKIAYVHNEAPNKLQTIEDFREGKIPILVASLLIKRGQNMPLIQSIINLAGGEGPEGVLQIIGRGTRTHESKSKFYFTDFWDAGNHLERHSKRRIAYYKNEGFKVIFCGGLKPKKKNKR